MVPLWGGVLHPLDRTGVIPAIDETDPASEAEIRALTATPLGWSNYRSAEDDPDVCKDLLQSMVSKGSHSGPTELTSSARTR